MGEYPFLTLTKYPPGFIQHIGGVVSARAVKLLGVDEAETRDSWWTELRLEVRAHTRALACNAVIAYLESTTVCEDVCILSASGTAAVINQKEYNRNLLTQVEEETGCCSVYHVPFNEASLPFRMKLAKCAQCKKGKVGEVLMCTAELMDGVAVEGRGSLVQAVVCRHKKDCKGELNAKEVSDALPFLEYELHTQLVHRLSSIGANAIVGLRVELCLGERVLVGHATGTGIELSALPPPTSPADSWHENDESDLDDCDHDMRDLDLSCGNKETCVLEVSCEVGEGGGGVVGIPPDGFLISTTQGIPGALGVGLIAVKNLQMFTQIWKARMCPLPSTAAITAQFHRLLQGVYFKLRGMTPCALANVRFKVDLPQQDDLQISVVGMAVGLAESNKNNSNIEEDLSEDIQAEGDSLESNQRFVLRPTRKSVHTPPREQRYGVDVTPLSYIPGGRILCYLGNLNFFFIRESTCIRETGGLSAFVHGFVAEILAIVRAHVTAIGGNALISYTMSECRLMNNAHKNQV
ncbi:hypothetical protein AAG570_011495 [Ranatra chinensis]|uniref:Uncharacterized protein n=1 Tax=Ranatra chinensis TaxID=642074 RepID=A0ABD0YMY2_9HEMI